MPGLAGSSLLGSPKIGRLVDNERRLRSHSLLGKTGLDGTRNRGQPGGPHATYGRV